MTVINVKKRILLRIEDRILKEMLQILVLIRLFLLLCAVTLASTQGKADVEAVAGGDLKAESSRQRIYDIIDAHENRKYGDHGGHEYEEGEIAQKLASRKRYGYLPVNAAVKTPVYYEAAPKDKVYRENVAAYAGKAAPLHLANAPHQVIASPVSNSHYSVVDPKAQSQYVIYDEPKPYHKHPLVINPKSSYILEEEPHYDEKVVISPPVVSHVPHYHRPVKHHSHYDDHHVLDKSHHSSGHGHYGDNSIHGESGHKAHKKGHYERDRGYHYEKAYAYDRVRAHHDIGSNKGAHSDYHSHHNQEGHKDLGDHGAQSYSYFKKNDHYGQHGHHDKNSLYKRGHQGGQGYHDYELKYISPHPHAYGK
ncbi:uncharacterized protein TNCV_647461 [Trichonephila clavipes]|uniref:Uncharacterized protein n=1 Tax=Trichonephila clavipes TaxID=2585209 RepID=A0A8X6SJ59_TRICX|nr:uncharacterized protein TNCV_647461 [Trichonephila clavipes]